MNIESQLTSIIEAAQTAALNSSVYYGVATGEINGKHVYLTAVPVFGRKVSFRKCWQIEGNRCKAADLIATIGA